MHSLRLLFKNVLYPRPRGIALSVCSRVRRPWRVRGGKFITIGDRTWIEPGCAMEAIAKWQEQRFEPRVSIGNDVYIGRHFYLTAVGAVTIEDGCVLSEHVYISDNGHGLDPLGDLIMRQPLVNKGDMIIGAHSFLGYRCCILPGVQLGEHCVVGANSVVTRSFPAYSMIAGIPARLIKRYSPQSGTWEAVRL